jgi:uncharacterized protein (AIM24 family)
MDITVEDGVGGLLVATLDAGESLLAASDALVDHTGGVRVERARGGIVRSVANAARQRHSTPVEVSATADATVRFSPTHQGSVVAAPLGEGGIAATRDAFVAATAGVRVGADRVGDAPARSSGLFLTTVAGDGRAFVAGRGRVDAVTVPDGEDRVVSAAHVVAYGTDAEVSVERAGAIEEAPPACRIRGPTTVWVASRPSPRFSQ